MMKKLFLVGSLLLLLVACTTVPAVVPRSTGAVVFDACKIGDGLTTAIGVSSGKLVELNPLLRNIVGGGMSWVPFGLVIAGVILLYNWADNADKISAEGHGAANTLTCGVAAHNFYLLVR